jgi:excisionase family DNA binding protein
MKLSADQFFAQPVLSVSEAAELLEVNPPRVRAMIAAEILDAAKVGGRWVVSAQSVEKRKEADVQPGRPLSPRRAWGLLLLASGARPDWLDPSEVSRLRSRIREESLEALTPRLGKRAVMHRLRAHPSDLGRIGEEAKVVRTGTSSATKHKLDLSPAADVLDAYLPAKLLQRLKKKYTLQSSPRPNVTLRVIDGLWPFEDGTTLAPAVVVGVDLIESDDARLQRAGQELLRRQK